MCLVILLAWQGMYALIQHLVVPLLLCQTNSFFISLAVDHLKDASAKGNWNEEELATSANIVEDGIPLLDDKEHAIGGQ